MYDADCEKVVHCPFNKNHVISSSRLQRHIVKCEKNYPDDFNVMCPYNASHRLKKWEIKDHIDTCPTRTIIEASQIQQPNTCDPTKSQEDRNSKSSINYEDSWREERMEVPESVATWR